MELTATQGKNQKLIIVFAGILIGISTLVLLNSLLMQRGYASMIAMSMMTRNFDPPLEINFTLYFIQNAVELLLYITLFISSVFVTKFKKSWRIVLVYCLTALIIFLVISPIINHYNIDKVIIGVDTTSNLIRSYSWSLILSAFFIVVIVRLSKEEVKLLFK